MGSITVFSIIFLLLVNSSLSFAKEGSAGCKFRHVTECSDIRSGNKADPDGINTQYCNYFEAHDMGCKQELWSGIAYTTAAAVCLTGCIMEKIPAIGTAAAQAIRVACTFGSMGVAAADIASTLIIKNQVDQKVKSANQNLPITYGTGAFGTAAGAVGGVAALYLANGSLAASKATNAEMCVAAVMDGMFAYSKFHNKKKLVEAAEKNYCQLQENMTGQDLGCASPGRLPKFNQFKNFNLSQNQTNIGGSSTANPDLNGSDSMSSEIEDIKKMPISEAVNKMNEAYAKAGDDKILGKPDFGKALKALQEATGANPNAFLASAAAGNLSDTMSKLLGNSKGTDLGLAMIKDAEKLGARLRIEGSANIAFEKPVAGGGANKKFANFGNDVFGDRGPAATGGAEKLSFGGFDGDIWHIGTTQSIFEIVSKKTTSVSNRVNK